MINQIQEFPNCCSIVRVAARPGDYFQEDHDENDRQHVEHEHFWMLLHVFMQIIIHTDKLFAELTDPLGVGEDCTGVGTVISCLIERFGCHASDAYSGGENNVLEEHQSEIARIDHQDETDKQKNFRWQLITQQTLEKTT